MKQIANVRYSRTEAGFALIASLFILVLVTILGMSTIGSSNLQSKMVNVSSSRQALFNAAEQTLAIVEGQIEADLYVQDNFYTNIADNVFSASCTDGLCFFGSYNESAADHFDCDPSPTTPPLEPIWKDTTIGSGGVWADASLHQTEAAVGLNNPVKYIIEFLCYVDRSGTELLKASTPNNGAEHYRITVLATDDFNRGQVMLQSSYKHIIN
jgi:type IV pilus assembly protein PilX